jgi:hypothetical protein
MSRPVIAQRLKPSASLPWRCARTATASPLAATTRMTGSQPGSTWEICTFLAITPARLWFSGFWTGLILAGLRKDAFQKNSELDGSTATPTPIVRANAADAVTAARRRLVSSK